MNTIHKFDLTISMETPLLLTPKAKPLCVQVQHGLPRLWVHMDTSDEKKLRRFRIYGTGHECDEPSENYVGTFQVGDGDFVWHLFEVK